MNVINRSTQIEITKDNSRFAIHLLWDDNAKRIIHCYIQDKIAQNELQIGDLEKIKSLIDLLGILEAELVCLYANET